MIRAPLLVVLLAASPGALLPAAPAGAAGIDLSNVRGVQEMVVSVHDLSRSTALYQDVARWQIIHEGLADPDQVQLWGVARNVPVQQSLLGNPGIHTGLLRLIRFVGVDQQRIRSSARPFDTGAIFNINALVKDMTGTFEALRDWGFQGFSDPNYYDIFGKRYGGAMLRGHDGVVINLLERVDEGYEDQPVFATMSNVNNATQVVADYSRAYEFFTTKLGWRVRWEASPRWPPDGSNNMSLPNSLLVAGAVQERAASFHLDPGMAGGTIEIFAFQGISGIDFAARAAAPNLGILMYVVHVAGLCHYLDEIAGRGVVPVSGPSQFRLDPYGAVLGALIRAPDGAWLQFIDQPNGDLPCVSAGP